MLSIVTDEISYDPMTAVAIAREWGITHFEIKRVFLHRLPFIEEGGYQVLHGLQQTYEDIKIVALSPGLFDRPMTGWEFNWDATAKLDESLRLCQLLEVPTLVVFGIKKTGQETFQQVVDHFGLVANKAEAAGIQVAIEPHQGNYVESAASGAKLFEAVASPNLGLNWDISNARGAGEAPLPDGYKKARPHIKHMHLKGSLATEDGKTRSAVIGEDDVPWLEIFKRCKADGIDVAFSIETHIKPVYENSRACVKNAIRLMTEAGLAP